MIITKEVISFAFVKDELEIDYIPLSEVEFIKEMKDIGDRRSSVGQALVAAEYSKSSTSHTIQISTTKNGHNSGRAYYIQIESQEKLESLLEFLQTNSKAARKRLEARNLFRMSQYRVRKVYESYPVQCFIALLIAAVR